ncbi:MAG: insulinase family protein [Deltaproteobacteria bacterium]|nr:insulinase family protein [Deltaproteobacteria bacterium]
MKREVFLTFVPMLACAPGLPGSVNRPWATVSFVEKTPLPAGLAVEKYRLSNGLGVLLIKDASAPVIAFQQWFRVGSRDEREGRTGIAHLFEHLMFKETKNMKDGEFDKTLEGLGGNINASTWLDWTFYRSNLHRDKLELLTRMEADRAENLILNQKQLDTERQVVMNERRYRVDNSVPGAMYEELYRRAFTKHPYRWPTVGWMNDLKQISVKDCPDFYRQYYAPNNNTVVVVGDFQTDEMLWLIRKYFGHQQPSKIARTDQPDEPAQTEERRVVVKKPITAEKWLAGFRMPAPSDADYWALQVANLVLFGGPSSRLYRKLITELEMAAEIEGWPSPFRDASLFELMVSMKAGKPAATAEPIVEAEIAKVAEGGITAGELSRAKNRVELASVTALSTMSGKAYLIGDAETTHGDYKKGLTVLDKIRAVTGDDVKRAVARVFRKANRTVVLAVPLAAMGGAK